MPVVDAEVLDEIQEEVNRREERWQQMISRHSDITALVSNNWPGVFDRDGMDAAMPMVENLFRLTLETIGRRFASQLPSETVRPANGRDEGHAEDRQKLLAAYTDGSRFWDSADWAGMDFIAAGFTAIKVWPNMGSPTTERFPAFRRMDPRMILPEPNWSPDKRTDNVLVRAKFTLRELQRMYPQKMAEVLDALARQQNEINHRSLARDVTDVSAPPELTTYEFHSSRYIARAVIARGQNTRAAAVLDSRDNETELCPIQIRFRPSWALEPMGALDDSKGLVRTQNRYMRMLFDYFVQMVYGGKLVWNVKNPNDRGPHVTYYALGPDAKMDPVTPESANFQSFTLLESLEQAARSNMTFPRSVEGDVQLNKASAAFLTRAQGQLTEVVSQLQRSYAACKRDANEVAFAQDEKWCDARKLIVGFARGSRFSLTYTPSELIKGDYASEVTYGTSSGLDPAAHYVLQLEKIQAGVLDARTYFEQDPSVQDVEEALRRRLRHTLEGALTAALTQGGEASPVIFLGLDRLAAGDTADQALRAMSQAAGQQAQAAAVGAAGTGLPALGGPVPPGQIGAQPPGVPGVGTPALPPLGANTRALPAGRR